MMRTVKLAIVGALEDLSPAQFDKFRHQLWDRRDKPRVTRCSVEGKDRLDVADLLVSTFTERRALDVTLETLRLINCNEEAERLGEFIHGGEVKRQTLQRDPSHPAIIDIQCDLKHIKVEVKSRAIRSGSYCNVCTYRNKRFIVYKYDLMTRGIEPVKSLTAPLHAKHAGQTNLMCLHLFAYR